MMTAPTLPSSQIAREGNRILVFAGLLLANLGAFGILFFWIIGAVHLLTGNGGQVNIIGLDGLALTLFWAYPVVALVSLGAWVLYLMKLDLPALGLAGAPVGLAVLYYLWLVVVGRF